MIVNFDGIKFDLFFDDDVSFEKFQEGHFLTVNTVAKIYIALDELSNDTWWVSRASLYYSENFFCIEIKGSEIVANGIPEIIKQCEDAIHSVEFEWIMIDDHVKKGWSKCVKLLEQALLADGEPDDAESAPQKKGGKDEA